jgi:hypothetical protein
MSDADPAPRYGERVDTDAAGVPRVEGRPAPGYGEYAPPGWVSPVASVDQAEPSETAQDPAATSAVRTDPRRPGQPGPDSRGPGHAGAYDAPPPTGRPVPGPPPRAVRAGSFNRFATFVLLAYGLYFVIRGALETSQFVTSYVEEFRTFGYIEGTFQSGATLHAVAVVSAVGSVAAFLLVAIFAIRRLRAGKRSWVVLLVAGLLANLITGIAVVSVLMNDPSFVGLPG